MNKPTRQLPSAMTRGESASMPTLKPPTSVPSISPESTWKISTTRQRSASAGIVNPEVAQGQTISHGQFSKYVPSKRHATVVPPLPRFFHRGKPTQQHHYGIRYD